LLDERASIPEHSRVIVVASDSGWSKEAGHAEQSLAAGANAAWVAGPAGIQAGSAARQPRGL